MRSLVCGRYGYRRGAGGLVGAGAGDAGVGGDGNAGCGWVPAAEIGIDRGGTI